MTVRRVSVALVLAMALATLSTTGCSVLGVGGTVDATVNGEKIYAKQVDEQFAQMQGQRTSFEGTQGAAMEKQFKQRILDKLISDALIMQEATKLGIKPTDAEIQQRYDQLKKQFASEAQFNDALQKAKLTPDKLKESIAQQLVIQKLMQRLVKNQAVTPKEIADFYKTNKAQFVEPEKFHVQQILFKPTDKALAEKVYKQVVGGGITIAAAAKKYSIDPQSRSRGGDIGFVSAAELVPEFGAAMTKLKIGQVSKPVKSQFGWHIIKVLGKKKAGQRTLSEVKEQIRLTIVQTRQRDAFNTWLADVKKKADIKTYL